MHGNAVDEVRAFYDSTVMREWERIAGRPEFLLTCRMMNRYIKSGDRVLDIGGGPGRYSMYLAQKGCSVTLFDLSLGNINFARAKAQEENIALNAISGDARFVDEKVEGTFDHVLLMGPMYHLLEEVDRVKAVNAALRLLKPGGMLFVTFILMSANIIWALDNQPDVILAPSEQEFMRAWETDKSFSGCGFTQAHFIRQADVLPFMAQFPLKKIHLFGQEGGLVGFEKTLLAQPQNVVDAWLDMAEKTWEREELLCWNEHLMYVGRKK